MSWEENSRTWKMMPLPSSVLFFAGVFCLFASLFLIGSSINSQSLSRLEMIGGALISGGFAIGWAYAGTRKIFWLFLVVGVSQFIAFNILAWLVGSHHTLDAEELVRKVRLNGHTEIALVIAGYILFVIFFTREGARFFKTQTEVRLAGEIHRTLVPAKARHHRKYRVVWQLNPQQRSGRRPFRHHPG